MPGAIDNLVKGEDDAYFQMYFDCNYRVTQYATAQFGYHLLNIAATFPKTTIADSLGKSFALPVGFDTVNVNLDFSGPYLGVNIHF